METTLTPTVYLPTKQLLKELKVSPSTLKRATRLLRDTLPAAVFDKGCFEEGYSFRSFQVLKAFFTLRSQSMPPQRCAEYLLIQLSKNSGV